MGYGLVIHFVQLFNILKDKLVKPTATIRWTEMFPVVEEDWIYIFKLP